jgi:hypothetical protein
MKKTNVKYLINGKQFKTKIDITEHFRSILYSNEISIPIKGECFNDVCDLLKHHIEYDEKIGVGVESITIEYHKDLLTNKTAKHPHFQINRLDGTSIDFSFVKCIGYINTSKSTNLKHIGDVKQAMRFIIKQQINEFRNDCFNTKKYLVCPILNINFSIKTCHIDHAPPKTFDVLVFDFLSMNNLNFNDIELLDINGIFSTFKNTELRDKWYQYHKENAIIRATHKAGNLSQKRVSVDWEVLI